MMVQRVAYGAIAGAVSALVFTALHQLIISNIWFMLIPMMVAGALCGVCIGWSYGLLSDSFTAGGWLGYNVLYLILLYLLAPISLLLFEPVITFPELLSSPDGLPDELVRAVTPFVLVYTPLMAVIITAIYRRHWTRFLPVLLTCTVLMMLLGMNISAMGLVVMPSGWLPILLKQVGLIVELTMVYALIVLLLTRLTGSPFMQDSIDAEMPA